LFQDMSVNVYIIAEAGVNHNGSLKLAYKLVDAAVDAGSNAVKFQTFRAENVISRLAQKAEYQKKNSDQKESQFEMVKKLELTFADFVELKKYCDKIGIDFLSSPFDLESIDFLYSQNVGALKIPSGEITNLPYLRHVGSLGKPLLLSTGMAYLEEIATALLILEKAGTSKNKITVLHCNTDYPTAIKDVNLSAMLTIRNELNVRVGYSDHTLGIEIPVAAVALGAVVIEKHFTLDRSLLGPDHPTSLEPGELKAMVKAIRNIEMAMGRGIKEPSAGEAKNISVVRKSLVAGKAIKTGEVFTECNLTVKRPGTGISPMEWDNYLGKYASRDYKEDDLIE
jgi:N,N'-diacetyllegionaminate synthase